MKNKIQLIFCRHSSGRLAFEEQVQHQPPLGLLVLASYIKHKFPNIQIEVIDEIFYEESELLKSLDGDIIGFSVWFSNYENSLRIAKQIKKIRPYSNIVFGGPHVTALGKNILFNNPFIDYVAIGEGEISLYKFLRGDNLDLIQGLYQQNLKNRNIEFELGESINLNELPIIDLTLLRHQYIYQTSLKSPSMSAFPLAGIRGCNRYKIRCEYCSIPFNGYRFVSANNYWDQISFLQKNYGINFFFETGDIFSKYFLKDLLKTKSVANIGFRIYGYPNIFNKEDIKDLKSIGVQTVYMGIESVLHWHGTSKRKYKSSYEIDDLIEEIILYQKAGIDIIPGFLLGLPGESENTLNQNIRLINEFKNIENVKEISVNIVLPLPGTEYFQWCINNQSINKEYHSLTQKLLNNNDLINYHFLSKLFVDNYCTVKYEDLVNIIDSLKKQIGSGMTNWNIRSFMHEPFIA